MTTPFHASDLYLHRKIMEIRCAPLHERLACVLQTADREQDGYRSDLWLFDLEQGTPRQLTQAEGDHDTPRWSPDERCIAFLSSRHEGRRQLYLLPLDGGEARPLGELDGISQLEWLPDGSGFIAAAAVSVDPERRGEEGDAPPPKRGPKAPELAWRLPYKEDGIGYLLARQIHLFRIDAANGRHERLTHGPFDVMAFDISADGRFVAYARSRPGRFAHPTDLWMLDLATGEHRRLTEAHAIVQAPAWSPDGRFVAFSGATEDGDAQPRPWLVEVATGTVRPLGDESLEVAHPSSLRWSADGTSLSFTQAWRGCHRIVSLQPATGELQVLVDRPQQFGAYASSARGFAYSVDHPSEPGELWVAARERPEPQRVSDFNPWWRERTRIVATIERFEVPDGDGGRETIEGWLLRGAQARGPAPLLVDMHGGPAAYALLDYDTNVFWQVLCSRGWSVLALNAVGSASYGREFCTRLAGRWGELDLPQYQAAIRALQQRGIADARVAVSGKSYGGYLSAWATGHDAGLRAAVVMAPVGNIETHYGTSDGGYYADPYYIDTAPVFDRRRAQALSPLHHIEKSRTPTLFLQGKEDERCPKCQSEELFVSLCRASDTPTELVLYPGEDHHFLGSGAPACREDAATRIVDWLERHVRQAAEAPPDASAAAEGPREDTPPPRRVETEEVSAK